MLQYFSRERAALKNAEAQKRYKAYFDKKRKVPQQYSVGDLVLTEKAVQSQGSSRKLSAPFAGPMVVKAVLSNDRYRVANLEGRKYERVVAIDKIRRWCQSELLSEDSSSDESNN